MNDFLNRIFWDNSIRAYVIVGGVILFVLLMKRFISRYIAGLIFRIVKKIWKDVDRKSFSDLVVQPLGFFLLIMVSIVSLHKLVFPRVLDVEIYKATTKAIIHTAGNIILIILFIWLLLRIIDFIALILEKKANLTADQSDNQLIVFFKDFFKVVVCIIGFLMLLNLGFGFRISNLITGLSIATAAIALATRESLENLIASFIIFFDKPYTAGDTVKVQHVTGTVEKIGLRSTRIRTDQKTFVTVPNKQMVDSILDNLSLRTQRKAEIRLELALSTSASDLEELIEKIKKLLVHPQIEESSVFLNEIKHNAFLIHADYFTAPVSMDEFNALKQEKNMEILKLMDELNIELAGASSDIRIIERTAQ
jgi:MscS family membrane protein